MERLRIGQFLIVKAHLKRRRYIAVVLDMSRRENGGTTGPHARVYTASREGWTAAARAECRAWCLSHTRRVHTFRTFTEDEQRDRDHWISDSVRRDCAGCETVSYSDGYDGWKPAANCPVHGLSTYAWWDELNRQLDARWPGRWQTRS